MMMKRMMGGAGNSTRVSLPTPQPSLHQLLKIIICIIVVVVGFGTADAKHKYVSLSPFMQWRRAYECLLNSDSSRCMGKDVLKLSGWIQVNESEVGEYCKPGGCADYIRDTTLTCIHTFKRDFWFANKATVPEIRALIDHGCSTNTEITTIQFTAGS